ncbi:unnamed protein product [Trichobilharzia regenti]|nr:unnamed protein product [Trichobilharzia regenti]
MNRLPVGGKQQQQHPPTHILPNMTSTGLRWPPPGGTTPQMQGVWSLTDQRRPGTVQGPQCRGVNQAFRTPQSAFYPAMTPGFTSSSSSSMSQRMFMSPQQHSQQLQQQSVIRAHVMRQLFSLGFSEDEIQPIFADTSTSVERALSELVVYVCYFLNNSTGYMNFSKGTYPLIIEASFLDTCIRNLLQSLYKDYFLPPREHWLEVLSTVKWSGARHCVCVCVYFHGFR